MIKSKAGSFLDLLYIKPYYYSCSYFNGIVTGYLMESNQWMKFKKNFNYEIDLMNTICKNILLFLTFIILQQNIIFSYMPAISALYVSLFHPLFSLVLCIIILDNIYYHGVNFILNMKIWKMMKKLLRVSYVFHLANFQLSKIILSKYFNSPILNYFNCYFVLAIHLFISILIHNIFEKKINKLLRI